MTEDFLHYLWRFRQLKPDPWFLQNGEPIEVLHPGYPNSNSGPDFEQARIKIKDQIWVGSVEIHITSSDWNRHHHQIDPAYNNVILHVVQKADQIIYTEKGWAPPCLSLEGLYDPQQYWRFEQKLQDAKGLVCAASFQKVDEIKKHQMLERTCVLRLEQRAESLELALQELGGNWDALLYRSLAKAIGAPVNGPAMESLSRVLPVELWRKYQDKNLQREALFLGMAGLLGNSENPKNPWLREFNFLKHKHGLNELEASIWKYSRMRPANFPDRRIAQLSQLLPEAINWFKDLRQGKAINGLELKWPDLAPFWRRHYRLKQESKLELGLQWSERLKQSLLINAIIPLQFYYGRKTARLDLQEAAINSLLNLPAEANKITRIYEQLDLKLGSAFDSQACIAWYKNYCQPKKCLTCTLGNELLNQ
ncbi:DUF2851 family protein [Croceimicrobium sp.]|uniref:DUF2851 family protein n=1 Tax=Croceimicrobium sp. TaxID=2828340 RepID=UPI003BABA9F4